MPSGGAESICAELLAFCREGAKLEVTLECEPGTITKPRLQSVLGHGVSRISVGAQTFDQDALGRIGRRHKVSDSVRLITDCREVGFENVHVDLMYGLPGQSVAAWERTVRVACDLPVSHVSVYKFYVYENGFVHRAKISPRPDAESATETEAAKRMYALAQVVLETAGFKQYTLTEFARPGRESDYVRSCFDGSDVLPIGPSAFGRCGQELWDVSPYVHLHGTPDGHEDDRAIHLSCEEAFKRDVILGCWLLQVNLCELAERYQFTAGAPVIRLLVELDRLDLLDFDEASGIVSVGEHQRFGIGTAMNALANLDAGEWAVSGRRQERPALDKLPAVLAVLRLARRDREVFSALRTDPVSTLHKLGYQSDMPALIDLCAIIANPSTAALTAERDEVGRQWRKVEREHGL
jgi:coproporphyrinogen III oxidase-like Fe-S oxidoreductase